MALRLNQKTPSQQLSEWSEERKKKKQTFKQRSQERLEKLRKSMGVKITPPKDTEPRKVVVVNKPNSEHNKRYREIRSAFGMVGG